MVLWDETKKAPKGTKDHDPALPCPECNSERYWSDYWTDEFVAICVKCIAGSQPRVKK